MGDLDRARVRAWAIRGAEPLRPNVRQTGELRRAGKHVYLSAAPLAGGVCEVALTKRGGGARAALTVCGVDRNGAARALWRADFAGGERNAGRVLARRLNVVEGQLLAVYLCVRGGRFAWTLAVWPP